jgi:hypothetical protein
LAPASAPTNPTATKVGFLVEKSAIPEISAATPPCPTVCQKDLDPAFSSPTPLAVFAEYLNLVKQLDERKNVRRTT